MLGVIIVDDEILIRKRLVFGFDWEAMGYRIEAEAGDGGEALLLMEKRQYDVAIIDIAMPGMNGIELSRKMKQLKYPTEVIILTAHSDFTYAKQALQNGVFDYVLKPIHEPEFIGTLKRLREKICHMDAVLHTKIFSDFFHDMAKTDGGSTVLEVLEQNNILNQEQYMLILIHMETFENDNTDMMELLAQFRGYSQSLLAGRESLITYDIYEDNIVVIVSCVKYESEETFINSLRQLLYEIKKQTKSAVQIGISLAHKEFAKLGKAYQEAFSAINNARVLGDELLTYKEVKKRRHEYYKVSYQELKDFQYYLVKNDFASCSRLIRRIFDNMENMKNSFESITLNVNRLFTELVYAGVFSELEIYEVKQALSNLGSVEEMADWCENVIFNLMENEIRGTMENKSLPIVEKACEYIRAHYQDPDLNQGQIAEVLAVSTSYISGVFKKAMGISMIQYITMVRMEKARELLLEESMNVKVVAEQTGYHDEYYFSRCFKKQYGLSPLQVRKIAAARRLKSEM